MAKYKFSLRVFKGATPTDTPAFCLDYELPGRKLKGGIDSLTTADKSAKTKAVGIWAYLQHPGSKSEETAQEYGIDETLEPLAEEIAEQICCAEVWRAAVYSQGLPPCRLAGFVSYADETRGGKWKETDATEFLKRIA